MPYLSYKYRIYPDKAQQQLFIKTFGCVRLVYNCCLEFERDVLNVGDPPVGQKDLLDYVFSVLTNEYPFLKDVDFNALSHAAFNLFRACRRYWDHVSNPPAFKSRKTARNSFTTSAYHNRLAVGNDYMIVPVAGKVKAIIHRPLPEFTNIQSFTISQEPDNSYFCSVLFSYSRGVMVMKRDYTNSIGLDYRAKGLYVDSNGNECDAPRYNLESEKKLKRAQKRLNRMVGAATSEKPSNNYLKQQIKLNKIYRKTVNRRNDYLHKKSAELVSEYDIICVEDLDMNDMAGRGHGLGKSTMDNSYGRFLELLDYKARGKGKCLVRVDRWFPSSQICSFCGNRQKIDLNERVFCCPKCGLDIDRDYNSAINIKREGVRILARGEVR